MSIAAKPITADELFAQGNSAAPCELIAGVVCPRDYVARQHSMIAARTVSVVGRFVHEQHLGAMCGGGTGFLVARAPDTVLVPMCSFVGAKRLGETTNLAYYFPGAPDLAVELVASSVLAYDVPAKIERWFAADCRSLWMIDAEQQCVAVYHQPHRSHVYAATDTLVDHAALPGFSLTVHELFDVRS